MFLKNFCWRKKHFRLFANKSCPYEVLGIVRTATSVEIKSKFRELAKRYHPDICKDDNAASRMAEITTAYEILSCPKQRAALDRESQTAGRTKANDFGSPFPNAGVWTDPASMYSEFTDIFGRMSRKSGGPGPMGARRGDDMAVDIHVDFIEAMKGCLEEVTIKAQQQCNTCQGTGARAGTTWSSCKVCNGTGTQRVDKGIMSMGMPCTRCGGYGQVLEFPCRGCQGSGTKMSPKTLKVKVPAGSRNLTELRLAGQGHAGLRGGQAGDLFVTLRVKTHPEFRMVEDDIHLQVPLSIRTSLLGGETQIPGLDGKPVKLIIPPRTLPASSRILKGKGAPKMGGRGSGDLVLQFTLKVPKELSREQVKLIEEFDSLSQD